MSVLSFSPYLMIHFNYNHISHYDPNVLKLISQYNLFGKHENEDYYIIKLRLTWLYHKLQINITNFNFACETNNQEIVKLISQIYTFSSDYKKRLGIKDSLVNHFFK